MLNHCNTVNCILAVFFLSVKLSHDSEIIKIMKSMNSAGLHKWEQSRKSSVAPQY